MKNLVIDASVAIKWFIWEEGTEEAHQLLEELNFFWVPALFLMEVDAILSKKVLQGELEITDAFEKRRMFRQLPYMLVPYNEIAEFAFRLSTEFPITLYDAAYLATAVDHKGIFHTADKAVVNGMRNTPFGENIKLLEY